MVMKKQNRREFLQSAAAVLAARPSVAALYAASRDEDAEWTWPEQDGTAMSASGAGVAQGNEGKKPLRLGLILDIGKEPDAALAKVRELGLPTCQVFASEFGNGF